MHLATKLARRAVPNANLDSVAGSQLHWRCRSWVFSNHGGGRDPLATAIHRESLNIIPLLEDARFTGLDASAVVLAVTLGLAAGSTRFGWRSLPCALAVA